MTKRKEIKMHVEVREETGRVPALFKEVVALSGFWCFSSGWGFRDSGFSLFVLVMSSFVFKWF